MSWGWQSQWWKFFGCANDLQPLFLKATTDDGETVAIIPLICWNSHARRFLPTRRMQLLGHVFQGPATMRTEYLDFLIEPDWQRPVVAALLKFASRDSEWDEFVLQDIPVSSAPVDDLLRGLTDRCYIREVSDSRLDETRYVSTDVSFEEYLAALSRNMRRSLYHGRKKLEEIGEVSLRYEMDPAIALELLNNLHAKRWGAPVFTLERQRFHEAIAGAAASTGDLRFSILVLNEKPVSILYDLVAGRGRYNLQLGFDPTVLGSKGSLGMIHFGYAIEECCSDPNIDVYDLLAGAGRKTLYKARMNTHRVPLRTVQVVRGRRRKLMYWLHDRMGPARLMESGK
jgi:CelD/BcsL family acetyltransferase involved in cellulose biosynthesis